jgi:sec-independent protein translocase protein TatA
MGFVGKGELLIILVVVIIFVGGTRLPQLGMGLGRGIRNFKNAIGGNADDVEKDA